MSGARGAGPVPSAGPASPASPAAHTVQPEPSMSDTPGRALSGPCSVGVHMRTRAPRVVELEWVRADGAQMRVRESTCHAHLIMYELGLVGGVLRIRRTLRGDVSTQRLTPVAVRRQTEEWWAALLSGKAV